MLFAVLSQFERHGWVHPSILQFFCEYPFLNGGTAFRVIPVHAFQPAAAGRNVFCKQAKDSEADWLCMIDNDMKIPENLLECVNKAPADADIIVPQFYMWNQDELKLVMCWGVKGYETKYVNFKPGYHELSHCGTGVIFIRPRVLRGMEYPYFKYTYNDDGCLTGTEDVQFCFAATAKGFKIYGYTEVKVGHFHSVDLGSMWAWKEKMDKPNENKIALSAISLDSGNSLAVEVGHQDAGRSPDRVSAESVPLAAD